MCPDNNNWRSDEKSKSKDFDWFGYYLPSGREGFTIMDVDSMVRWHGPNFNTDSTGYFIIQERKTHDKWKNKTFYDLATNGYFHQYMKYKILDKWLQGGNMVTGEERYKGTYLIWSNESDFHYSTEFQINGEDVKEDELIDFYLSKLFDRFPRYRF